MGYWDEILELRKKRLAGESGQRGVQATDFGTWQANALASARGEDIAPVRSDTPSWLEAPIGFRGSNASTTDGAWDSVVSGERSRLLDNIAENPFAAFEAVESGEIAPEALVSAGVWTEEDLAEYRASKTELEPGMFGGEKSAREKVADVGVGIAASALDLGVNVVQGFARPLEGISDLIVHGIAKGADWLGYDEWAKETNERASESFVDRFTKPAEDMFNKKSAFGGEGGDSMVDSIAEGVGQLIPMLVTGGVGTMAGLGAKGVTALTTAFTGASAMGSGISEAYNWGEAKKEQYDSAISEYDAAIAELTAQDAEGNAETIAKLQEEREKLVAERETAETTDAEAWGYGTMAGVAEAGTELIFGGLGKAFKATGLSHGLSNADDVLAKKVSSMIKSQLGKNLAEYGIKAGAEGFEEVAAGVLQGIAQSVTYRSEDELKEIIEDQNLLESFVVGAVTSGIAQSGYIPGMKQGSLREANAAGRDFITGLNQTEQSVIDKVYEDRLAEKSKDGEKVTSKEKNKLYEEVMQDFEEGGITVDTIEEVLGGDTYKEYQDAVNSEKETEAKLQSEYDDLKTEYDELYNMKSGDKSDAQIDRQKEIKARMDSLQAQMDGIKNEPQSNNIRSRLSEEVFNIAKDTRLSESYNERARRGEAFTADLTEYDEKQREIVQKAIDSGVLNNTRRSHKFVDMVAKIAADKGISFDFTNNERLKQSGFAIDGTTINGFAQNGNVTINMESKKALDSLVGHEVTHVLEGTDMYDKLKDAVFEYASTKKQLDTRRKAIEKLYPEGTDIDSELVADLVGDYIFNDVDFIRNLSTKDRNLFQKIYDEIKYLTKVATAGSKEYRDLEKAKKAFAEVYRESGKNKKVADPASDADIAPVGEAQKNTAKDGDVKYALSGKNRDGIEVYETSEETKALTWKERKAKYIEVLTDEYRGRTARFERNGHVYYAKFDQSSVRKHIYGDSRSSKDGVNALIKAGADGDVFDLVENSRYTGSQPNKKNHTKADYFDYFVKTVQIDGKVFDLVADVEKKYGVDGGYVYTLALVDNKTIKASPALGTPKNGPVKNAGNASDDKVPQNSKNVKGQFSLSSDSEGNTLTNEQREYFKDSKVVDENGNLKVMYHGTPNGGFHTFSPNYTYDGISMFFTDRNDVAATYSSSYETYEAKAFRSTEEINGFFAEIGQTDYEVVEGDGKYTLLEDGDEVATAESLDEIYDEFRNWVGVGYGDVNYKAYLNITNPFVMDAEGAQWNELTYRDESGELKSGTTRDVTKYAKEQGYDGVIFNNIVDGGGYSNGSEGTSTVAVAFSPEQIKSVANTQPTADSDIRYSLSKDGEGESAPDVNSTEYKIVTSMTMAEAKRMIETAYKVNEIAEYYEGEYANAEDWLKKAGPDEVAMYVENDYDLQEKYVNSNEDILNEEYSLSDVLEAYLAGTLKGKEKPKPKRLDVSQSTKLNDDRFYSPQKIADAKATYELALQKASGKDASAVQQARAEILLFAHNKGAAELLGVSQAELNKKLRSWSNYSATAKSVSERINAGVAEENRWTGIENSAYISKARITNEDIERMVASVEGDSQGYERRYIARVMLAADTHIDYSGLTIKFGSSQQVNADHNGSGRVLGFYNDGNRTIEVTHDKPHTVAHEMGHYIDAQWGRDLLGTNSSHLFLTQGINANMVRERYGEPGVQFLNNFKIFMNSLSDVNQNNNSYYNDRGEIFARFFARFVEWTDNLATGNKRYGYESTLYNDNFTQAQFVEFAKLLQEKALLDGSTAGQSASTNDIAPLGGVKEQRASEFVLPEGFDMGTAEEIKNKWFPDSWSPLFHEMGIEYINNKLQNAPLELVEEIAEHNKIEVEDVLAEYGYGNEDIAPIQDQAIPEENVAPVQDTVQDAVQTPEEDIAPVAEVPIQEEPVQEVLTEEEMFPDDYAPLSEEDAAAMQQETLESITDEDAPLETERTYDELGDSISIDNKSLKQLSKGISETLGLKRAGKAELERVVQEFSRNEHGTREDLYNVVVEHFGTNSYELRIDEIADAKAAIRDTKIKVTPDIKSEFGSPKDYLDFMRKNFGKIKFSNEGRSVDVVYEDLRTESQNSSLFPEDIINPADRLRRIAEVANEKPTELVQEPLPDEMMQEVTDMIYDSIMEYKDAERAVSAFDTRVADFAGLMQNADEFAPPMDEDIAPVRADTPAVEATTLEAPTAEAPVANAPIKTIKDRLEARLRNTQTEIAENQELRRASREVYDQEIARLYEEYDAKPNKHTKAAQDLLRRAARMQTMRENTDADYEKRLNDLEAKRVKQAEELRSGESTAEQGAMRAELHARIVDDAKTAFAEKGYDLDEVLEKAKDLSTFSTVDNTPQRVMEKTFGYEAGQILSDLTVNKVAQHETEGIEWLNSFTDRKNGLIAQISKQYHIKPGSKESAAAQMYAEGFYEAKNGDLIEYGDKELAKDFPKAKTQENIKGLAKDQRIRQIYDETLAKINESRARNAYPEIQRLDNYYLHFRAMSDTFSKLGIPFNPNDIRAKDLPTDLNGVTADLKPGQPYFASAMHRMGKRTSFDLLGGLEMYLTSAKDQIYHIDDIQTLRALRNYIADTYGQAKGLEGLDLLTEEEAQKKIEDVYKGHLSNFAKFLNEEANVIAGKTSLTDRGLEGVIGRRGITFLGDLNKQVGSNMVGFNVSSSLTNLISVVQGFAKSNKFDFVKAMAQTASNGIGSIFGKTDGFTDASPVIVRRKGAERFHRTAWQKASDAGYVLMGVVDNVSTEIIARAKYNELTRKGMDSKQAHVETDKWVSRLMGDRSLGQQPLLYNSKMLGMFTKFQLEVRNQLDSQFYDTVQEAKMSTKEIENGLKRNAVKAAKITSTFVQLAVLQHLFGKAFESVAGYNPAFDIIEALVKTFGWDDEEDDEDTVLDNVQEGFLSLMGDLPYTSTFTGGRIPISSALPIEQLVTGKDQYNNEKSRLDTIKEALPYYVLPSGYGQIKKTAQGLGMFDEENPVPGSYTDSGNLRFPVEDTIGNRVQAGLFGQWANETARDYIDNERKPLEEKQIQEYMDVDLPIADYWNYREGLSGLKTLAEKADYINSLDLEDWQKNLLINNIADRDEDINMESYDDYSDFEEFDFAQKNPEKYEFLQKNGVTYAEYDAFDEATKNAYNWAFKNPEKHQFLESQNVTLKDYATFDDDAKDAYSWAYDNQDKIDLANAIAGDVVGYRQYASELFDIKADKDEDGKSVSGSRKNKVVDYLNNLDADYGTKILLFKSQYPADDTYNYDIIDYLNEREDIDYNEMVSILRALDFKVYSDGTIEWE